MSTAKIKSMSYLRLMVSSSSPTLSTLSIYAEINRISYATLYLLGRVVSTFLDVFIGKTISDGEVSSDVGAHGSNLGQENDCPKNFICIYSACPEKFPR
jgi:hypothetical protein